MPHAASPATATFRDPELEARFVEHGFVVVDLFDDEDLDQILGIADSVYVDERSGFHASNLSGAHAYRHAVNREVSPIVGRVAASLFTDHEPYFSSLVVKWVDGDSSFPSHQDWNMVDEGLHRSLNVFVPLVDATEANGALRVLPGSHRVLRPIRCSPMPPAGCESAGWRVTPEEMEVVELRRGQVLVFDHALLHCSAPNTTDDPRWAAITAFKPRGAELYHWYLPDPERHELEVYRVDSDFFADFDIGNRPEGEPVRVDPFVWDPISKDELLTRCGREPSGDADDGVAAPPYAAAESAESADSGRVLRHDDHQRHLDEFGWVVVDAFDDEELERLRAAHASLDHHVELGRSFAAGFHATVVDGREEYRRASHAAIVAAVTDPCRRLFVGMDLVFTNWVHKEPGAAAAPRHVDWSFVDEPANRSVSFWSPLVDTDASTGCFGVLDESHHSVGFVRAAAHPGYDESDRVLSGWPGARLVPLAAGQAIIYDHRTVHFSQPHHGPRPRVAVTCEFAPVGAELVHFEQLGPGRFRRHVVTPEFFTTYTAGEDPRQVAGHVRDEDVSAPSFDQLHPSASDLPQAEAPAVASVRGTGSPSRSLWSRLVLRARRHWS